MSQAKEPSSGKLIYLQRVELGEICFLQEVLYWVAFGRLPTDQDRDGFIEGYKADVPNANGELTEEECKRAGLPKDPRLKYHWAWDVMLSDDLEAIAASRALVEDDEGDESAIKEQRQSEVANLYKEISEWKPKYDIAIELAASEIYAALARGRLTSRGVLLPSPDVEASLKMLDEEGKKVGDLEIVAIPKTVWSLPQIYWEISAARNNNVHYCHIRCLTEEVLRLFPQDNIVDSQPLGDGLVQYGSFFVLSSNSAATTSAVAGRQSKSRSRGRGRPSEYRWTDLHVEMAGLVLKGLPAKKDAAVEHVRQVCVERQWPVPAIRTVREWLTPYYQVYGGNSDR
jgi:hypothetical protein